MEAVPALDDYCKGAEQIFFTVTKMRFLEK
jgi:hypothetical protein